MDCNTNYKGQGIDQVQSCIDLIKKDPMSRRIVMSLWNVKDLDNMSLQPCHGITIQFYVNHDRLDCQMYQRSGDMFLGVPFNIFSYSVMTYIIAKASRLKPGRFIHIIGDAHIYKDHIKQCEIQVKRIPKPFPCLLIDERDKIDDYTIDDFTLVNYISHPRIKGIMNV